VSDRALSGHPEREKISFHQLNKSTGHRIKYRKVDAETGDEVESSDIIKGYEVGKGQYIELDPEELEAVAIESKRTIDIDEFVSRDEIDELYLNSPYYIAPDGEVGQQAFAVIREAIRKEGMVATATVLSLAHRAVRAVPMRKAFLLAHALATMSAARLARVVGNLPRDGLPPAATSCGLVRKPQKSDAHHCNWLRAVLASDR
jgi:DNA end-binding protein Ku